MLAEAEESWKCFRWFSSSFRLIVMFLAICDAVIFLLHVELMDFKTRRINHFKKNLVDLAELELKHARVSSTMSLD